MSTCPKHGCVLTETITDDVFCGVCRDWENKEKIKELEIENQFYKAYAGTQHLMNDFQNADQMRAALQAERFVVEQLKLSIINTMVNNGWTYSDAAAHMDREFTAEKAAELLRVHENNNATSTGS